MITLSQLRERLEKAFVEEKEFIEILEFKNMNSAARFLCKKCGKEFSVKPETLLKRHSGFYCLNCNDANSIRRKQKQQEQKIQKICDNSSNIVLIDCYQKDTGERKRMCLRYYCSQCGKESEVLLHNLKNDFLTCQHCGKGSRKNLEDFQVWLDKKYEGQLQLVKPEEYEEKKARITVKCKQCGFIFSPSLTNLRRENKKVLCPKCKSGKSRAEIYIAEWLEKNSIQYETEKNFPWLVDSHKRFDFVIESKKLIIEYDGEQHYRSVDFFGGEEKFNKLQESDEFKTKKAVENGYQILRIPYFFQDRLKEILSNLFCSTTIPQGSRGKLLEINSFLNKEEDIV